MVHEHPFQTLFESLGHLPQAHAAAVNRQAYEVLSEMLTVPMEQAGRCILLRAPRAGHGKTHLLSRIQHQLGASHEFIALHATFGCQIDVATVMDDTLRRLMRPLPASSGLCVLDLLIRRLFGMALQPMVGKGEVPCEDRDVALVALRARPVEIFDFHDPAAVTGQWVRENFEVLGQRFSVELAQLADLPIREVSFWVEVMFRFAATPVESAVRHRVLVDEVQGGHSVNGVLMTRLETLLGLLTLLTRVVLVADNLDGFATDETAALRLAAFLGALRQSVERLDVILSLNQDIWKRAFMPQLSGGLADRLSEVVIELKPLSEDEMLALLESRVPGLGSQLLARVDRAEAGTHARGLIQAAGVAWLRATAMDAPHDSSTPAIPVIKPELPVSVALPMAAAATITAAPLLPVLPAPPPPATQESFVEHGASPIETISPPANRGEWPVFEFAAADVPSPFTIVLPDGVGAEMPTASAAGLGTDVARPQISSVAPGDDAPDGDRILQANGNSTPGMTDSARADGLLRQFMDRYDRRDP